MAEATRVTDQGERARWVEEAVHSARMEGLELAPEDAADAADYVAGRITIDEYGRRTRARYGVPEQPGQAAAPAAAARPSARKPSSAHRR